MKSPILLIAFNRPDLTEKFLKPLKKLFKRIVDCNKVLKKVKNLFVKYYSILNKPQGLYKILEVLTSSTLRYHMENNSKQSTPFIGGQYRFTSKYLNI